MKLPYLRLPFAAIFLSCMALPAWAEGTCRITRIYENDKKQMVHNSRYPLYGEAERDVRACERVCKRDAMFLPRPDASKVKKMPDAQRVEVRCSFAQKGNDAGLVTARFNAAVNQLQLKSTSGSSTSSAGYKTNRVTTPSGMITSRPTDVSNGSPLITTKDIERDNIHRQKAYPPAYKPTTESSRQTETGQQPQQTEYNPFTTVSPEFRADDYGSSSNNSSSSSGSSGSGNFNPRMLRTPPQYQPKTY